MYINEIPTFERPHMDGLPIYVDGQLNRSHEVVRYASFGARMVGYIAWKGLELSVNAIESMQASLEAPRASK